MAAKLLHSLTDENPDLQKQIGCMTGIFQIFDRNHILSSGRIVGHSHKRLPPGTSHFNNGSSETGFNGAYQRQSATDSNLIKNVNEKQRFSMESSRTSFSSSSRSSFSSLECNRTAQPEPSSMDRITFPETPSRDPAVNQPSISPKLGRQSLELRDVVKDSIYREVRGLSVKTTSKEEALNRVVNHRDSPRPLQLSKSVNGTYGVSVNGKKSLPVDLKESIKVLKLQEAPWYVNEAREFSRSSSHGSKDGSLHTISKDAPRFSYDGRETNRLSFESRETFRSAPKLKDLPRLSLDSVESSMRRFSSDSKSNALMTTLQRGTGYSNDKINLLQQTPGTQKRPPSVVAKLMGLEALPDSASASASQTGHIRNCPAEDCDSFLRSSNATNQTRSIQISDSPRKSWTDPASPRRRSPDSVMKPILNSRFPIEPAPWKQLDANRSSLKPASRHLKSPTRASNTFPSVYSEIEKRLKDLEFKQSGKDLRALKQILEAMQAKGLLQSEKEEHASNFATAKEYDQKYQNSRMANQQNPRSDRASTATIRGANSLKTFESPIVIMKPAKLVQKSGVPASSVIPIDSLPGLNKLQGDEFADRRKGSVNGHTTKDQTYKNGYRNDAVSSADKRSNGSNLRSTQSQTRPQHLPRENLTSSMKSSSSVSPRMLQKKLEFERRSRPPTPPSDTGKSRRHPNRQPTESSSPGGKRRPKSSNLQPQQQSDDQLSEISNESRNPSYQGDDISLQSDSNMTLDLKSDIEVTSLERSSEINGSRSPSMKGAKQSLPDSMQKRSTPRLCEDGSVAELATVAPEHPSPVSVLDASVYRDDSPPPVKQIANLLKENAARNSTGKCDEEQFNTAGSILSYSMGSGLTSEINRKKLQNVENLVQKLRRLNSSHDEASTDYIASLCDNTNPDHRYISEILLASGLLLRDLGSGLTNFQLHPSGHPINPELFLVLEQTKASTLLPKEELHVTGKLAHPKPDKEKIHRKLIFDAVNEVLAVKLASLAPLTEPWLKPTKLARKTMNAQKLLRELCCEIEQLEPNKSKCSLEEEDGPKTILREDVVHRSDNWTEFSGEISGLVLDVERLLFKDLVDEVVLGEAANFRTKPGRHCRKLFNK